eukprot:m.376314 g.376314  ORF g.376314 m.376314 type:complete len:702 (-) comp56188_c0_seq2:52-2157(-)
MERSAFAPASHPTSGLYRTATVQPTVLLQTNLLKTQQEVLEEGWRKATTDQGVVFFLNSKTRVTQWVDPRLERAVQALNRFDFIQFACYRAAVKVRDLQLFSQLSSIPLRVVTNAFHSLDLGHQGPVTAISHTEVFQVVLEIFSGSTNALSQADIAASWLIDIYDEDRSGFVNVRQLKIALSALSAAWIEEKFKYAVSVLDANNDAFLTRDEVVFHLRSLLQILENIQEAYAFGATDVDLFKAYNACAQTEGRGNAALPTQVPTATYIDWLMTEPVCVVWLATFHRTAAAETSKHEAYCAYCKMYPIVGFRYKNMKVIGEDLCQECFWSQRFALLARNCTPADFKEYCLPATMKQDVSDFGSKVKRILTPKSKKKDSRHTQHNTLAVVSGPTTDVTSRVAFAQASTRYQRPETAAYQPPSRKMLTSSPPLSIHGATMSDEHDLIQFLAARIAAVDDEAEFQQSHGANVHLRQRAELLRIIEELDGENRDLISQLREARYMLESLNSETAVSQRMVAEERVRRLQQKNDELSRKLKDLRVTFAQTHESRLLPSDHDEEQAEQSPTTPPETDLAEFDAQMRQLHDSLASQLASIYVTPNLRDDGAYWKELTGACTQIADGLNEVESELASQPYAQQSLATPRPLSATQGLDSILQDPNASFEVEQLRAMLARVGHEQGAVELAIEGEVEAVTPQDSPLNTDFL